MILLIEDDKVTEVVNTFVEDNVFAFKSIFIKVSLTPNGLNFTC